MKTLSEYIMTVDDVMPQDVIREILNEYGKDENWLTYGGSYTAESGSVLVISAPQTIGESQSRQELLNKVSSCFIEAFKKYHAKYARADDGKDFLMVSRSTPLRLLRYQTGQSLPNHVDKHPDLVPGMQGWPSISITIHLNDDYNGGEVVFLDGEVTIPAKAGRAVIFPSNFLFPHAVSKVTKGTRYVVVTWVL